MGILILFATFLALEFYSIQLDLSDCFLKYCEYGPFQNYLVKSHSGPDFYSEAPFEAAFYAFWVWAYVILFSKILGF